ncbi:hypothetical protein ABIB45_000802 [Arthrobacter sp. UYCo732]
MTAYRFVTLTCDSCGEVFDDGASLRIPEARRRAAFEGGWATGAATRLGKTDYCPRCKGEAPKES